MRVLDPETRTVYLCQCRTLAARCSLTNRASTFSTWNADCRSAWLAEIIRKHKITLSQGSRLIFYSDGITEAVNANEEEYGLCRLAEHAIQPERFGGEHRG